MPSKDEVTESNPYGFVEGDEVLHPAGYLVEIAQAGVKWARFEYGPGALLADCRPAKQLGLLDGRRGGARRGAGRPRKAPTSRIRLADEEIAMLPYYRGLGELLEKYRRMSAKSDAEIWGKFEEFSRRARELEAKIDARGRT